MQKLLLGAVAAAYLGVGGTALANGSLKDIPEPLPPVITWTGFYIGGGIGAGAVVHELKANAFADEYYYDGGCSTLSVCEAFSSSDLISYNLLDASLNFDGIGGEGIFGTLQIGYDWQFDTRGVFGFFADADLSGIETDLDFSASSGGETFLSGDGEVDMDWMWTIGARLGYLATPDTLIYFLIGYTQAEFDDPKLSISYDSPFGSILSASSSSTTDSETFRANLDTFSGVTLGLGMETRLDANWGLKLEYRFTQLSDEQLFSISEKDYDNDYEYTEYGASADLEPSIHTGRVLLTYRFNRAPEPIEPFK